MSTESVRVGDRVLKVSNLAKVLFPEGNTTKAEVLGYYLAVADRILPQLRDRPVTRIRWPDGTASGSFFEKNLPAGAPAWLPRVQLPSPSGASAAVTYPLVLQTSSLIYLANLASLEFHTPQWRIRDGVALNPDRLVIDLDPGHPADEHECAVVALAAREALRDLGLDAVPVTSGSKGIHLYVPLADDGAPGPYSSEQVSAIAGQLAELLANQHPDLVTARMAKSERSGRVFLDWSQNNAAKTTVTPYSLRGRLRARVAWPRTWAEIENGAATRYELGQLSLAEALARLEAGDLDPLDQS